MKTEAKELQEFAIKGELIETINLTDTFKKVKEIVNNEERHDYLFINNLNESISHFDLYRLKDNEFPITIIKTKRSELDSGDFLDNLGK